MQDKILTWFATGRVGASSKAMAIAVSGIASNEKLHPSDPDDLNRCLLFLEAVPEARNHLDKVAALSDYWKALIHRFDEIEQTFLEEVGLNWSKGNSAPRTYNLMKEVLNPIEDSDPKVFRFGKATISIS